MGIKEAIIASDFIECDNIVAMHYDTFGYIIVDKKIAKESFENKGKKLTFVELGETITI